MLESEQKKFQRHIAYKIRISDILNTSFIKDDFSAGYISLNNTNVFRVNIIATVVYKSELSNNTVIDDGSGRIMLRSFENNAFSKVEVGDIALVIGKIRGFNDEKYIVPEILKKIKNIEWLNFRKSELTKNIQVTKMCEKDFKTSFDIEEVYLLIKKLDVGDGVPVDDIIKKYDNADIENLIKKLLESGDIFEIKPGKLKVLE